MSLYGEFQEDANGILQIIREAYDEIENASSSTDEVMDMVQANIDGAPSGHVDSVKNGISEVRQSFSNALSALESADTAMRALIG